MQPRISPKIAINPHWTVAPKIDITKAFSCIVSIDNLVSKAPGAFDVISKNEICICKYFFNIFFL